MPTSRDRTGLTPQDLPDWRVEMEVTHPQTMRRDTALPVHQADAIIAMAGARAARIAERINAAPSLAAGGKKTLRAIARNASAYAKKNEPLEIRINIPDGWATEVACIRVRDSVGYLPWQWEPARHARTGNVDASHGSGNVKAGSVWVMVPYVVGRGTVEYIVEVWPTAQVQSFPSNISLINLADKKRYTGPDFTFAFDTLNTWHPYEFKDTPSGRNFFSASTSCVEFFYNETVSPNPGVFESSGPMLGAAAQTAVYQGERDSTMFGYGVVFRWMIIRSRGATLTKIQHDVAYKVFANGTIRGEAKQIALSATTPTSSQFGGVQVAFDSGAVNGKIDGQMLYNAQLYPDGTGVLFQITSITSASDEDGASYSPSAWPGTAPSAATNPSRLRVGWTKPNYAIPANASRGQTFEIRRVGADGIDAARSHCWAPMVTTAALCANEHDQLARIGQRARKLLQRYTAWSVSDTPVWQQAFRASAWAAVCDMDGASGWSAIPGYLDTWLSINNRGPADRGLGQRLFDQFKAGLGASGFEFVGTDADALFMLRSVAERRGDAGVHATCSDILAGIAEMARLAEADNGRNGQVILNYTDSAPRPNINAAFAAMVPLAYAAAIGRGTPEQRVTLNRMWAAMQREIQHGWVGYIQQLPTLYAAPIDGQIASYFGVVMQGFWLIQKLLPGYSAPIDTMYPLIACSNALGQVNDYRFSAKFDRRGLGAVGLETMVNAALMGNVSDMEQGIVMADLSLASGNDALPFAYVLSGWANNVSSTRAYGKAAAWANLIADRLIEGE